MEKLTPNQIDIIKRATQDRDFCALAHGKSMKTLVDKGYAEYTSGFGHRWGRIITLTEKGIQKSLLN